ncbi:PPC domain-containing protein, partial [Myxococcota bacterium]|nr:PPC domain-containing protein [Myxococcota bacterium]
GSFEITTIEKDGETYGAKDAFRKYIPADDEKSAEANPLYKETTKGDLINIDLTDAVIKAKINVMSFDEATGYPRKDASDIVLDFANPPDEPIMIDSVMKDAGKREMYEISLDVKEKTWNFQLIKMERQDDGSFKKVPVGDIHKEPFDPSEMVGQHETSLDDPETYVEFLRKTQMTGRGVTAETADGAGVWNGRLETLDQKLEMREGSWERVSLDVDARYGANTGRYLAKLNEKGEAEFYVPLAMPADFWWRSEIAFAPEVDNLLNMKARDRGLLSTVNGSIKADAISNFMELLHCGFNERAYTLVHEGQRYYFDDKASWEAEIAKIEGLRSAIYAAPTPDVGTGAPVAANLITESGVLAYNEFKHYEVKAEVDGKITIVLETKLGDADLYVKKGAKASDEEYDLRSINGGEDTDTLIIDAKAGETYNLAILGYALSDYSLTVDGFKAGDVATPPPVLEPVNFTSAGQVTKGQEEHFEIIAVADGELDINMTGSGDADIYLRVGEKPTTNEWDFRPYKGSSTESGKIKVKAGDVIYGMVRGYGTTSDYNLNIKEA